MTNRDAEALYTDRDTVPKSAFEVTVKEVPGTGEHRQASTMFSGAGTVRCTVADVDMVGYSDVARMLEENTSAGTVGELNRQIQGFITSALNELTSPGAWRILAFTGDGGILLFERPEDAHQFGCSLQLAAKRYSERRSVSSAKRRFRIGIATGEVNLSNGGQQGDQYAGIAIANAVRLQTAAAPSEILIDSFTFAELTASSQGQYAPAEDVRGKRDETFRVRRCAIKLEDALAHEESSKELLAASQKIPWWKRRIAISFTVALTAIAVSISIPYLIKSRGQGAGSGGPETASVAPKEVPNAVDRPAETVPAQPVIIHREDSVAAAPVPAMPKQQGNAAKNARPKPDTQSGIDPSRSNSAAMPASPRPASDTRPPDPSEFDSASLVGTWEIASGDSGAAEVTLLELHADGTYKKTLNANVKNPDGTSNTYGTTHNGRWRSRGPIVYLSGDGNSPEYLQDLSKARKLN